MSDEIISTEVMDNLGENVNSDNLPIPNAPRSVMSGFQLPTLAGFQATLGTAAVNMLAMTMLTVAVKGSLWAGKQAYKGTKKLVHNRREKFGEWKEKRAEEKALKEFQSDIDAKLLEEDEDNLDE